MEGSRYKVLLVEDNDDHAHLAINYLSMVETITLETERASDLKDAIECCQEEDYDIVLLDLMLPDSGGLDTFKRFHARYPQLPVVVVSDLNDEALAINAVGSGAQDYLLKGDINPTLLTRAILYALVRHEKDENLRKLALVDELSQLYNRRGFISVFQQSRKLARRANRGLILIMVDMDGLKGINDTYGHQEGDRAIIDTGKILQKTFRASDLVGRIGGDEFAVLAVDASGENPQGIRERLQSQIDRYNRSNPNFNLSLSIGVIKFDPAADLPLETLLDQADQDLYDQKRRKKADRL
jgi:diguanylate cyclase (GGDEF)-like protein